MEVIRGDVFFAELDPVIGSEQGGTRPVVVIQNDIGNKFSPTIVAAITSYLATNHQKIGSTSSRNILALHTKQQVYRTFMHPNMNIRLL